MTHAHAHPHTHSDAAHAAHAQREATVIGWVGETPIPRARLDERVQELRAGRMAGRLPTVGSKEDRQFLRWTAQVLLTEELCRVELARLKAEATSADAKSLGSAAAVQSAGVFPGGAGPARVAAGAIRALTQAESLHLGSINAAAWANSSAVSELFDRISASTPPAPASGPARAPQNRRTWYRVVHAVAPTPSAADAADLQPLGWTTLDDLPAALATELRAAPPGVRVGPIHSAIGWHIATVTATELRTDPRPEATGIDPPRLAAFNRRLDERRRALVVHAHGFEHPGDPSQPDNTHRH